MTTITTSNASLATAYSNQRKVDRCQNGVLWTCFAKNTAGTGNTIDVGLSYSTDDGATWTADTDVDAGANNNYNSSPSFFVDVDDYAHLVYKGNADGYIYYRRGIPANAARTAWTWSAATVVWNTNTSGDYPDIVAHREGTGWAAHVVYSYNANTSTDGVHYVKVAIDSAGTVSTTAAIRISTNVYGNTTHKWPSIDLNHTGDGKTIAGSTPHLYVAWSAGATGAGNGIRFKKATYSGGSWTWGTEREIDSTRYVAHAGYYLVCMFDGTRVVLSGRLNGPDPAEQMIYDRDAADTTTTTRSVLTFVSATTLALGTSTYDSNGNVYLFGRNEDEAAGTFDLAYRKWDRAAATLGPEVVIDSGVGDPYVSAKRGHSNSRIEFIYTDGTASPYTVTYDSISLNTAPNAPTSLAPSGTIDKDITQRFSWSFSDPDTGDAQSAYELQYRLQGAASWTTVSGGATQYHDFAAGTFTAGDWEWQVRTTDNGGLVGPYSASSTFSAAATPSAPSISSPINGATISTSSATVTWTASSQDAYEVRRVADAAGAPDTGTVYSTTGTVVSTGRSQTLTFDVNNRDEHVQVRVRSAGLWSTWASVAVSVSYTPPAVPQLDIDPDNSTGAISVGITNPPDSMVLDLDGSGDYASTPDANRLDITGDLDVRVKAALDDWTPASGHYLVAKDEQVAGRSWQLFVGTDGRPQFFWFDSVGASTLKSASAALGLADGAVKWIRATMDVDDGAGGYTIRFYTSDDGATWTQLGADVVGATATSIQSTTAAVWVGGAYNSGSSNFAGTIYNAEVRSGIDGAVVASFDAEDGFVGQVGGTVTTPLPAKFVHLDGAGDYASTPDSDALDVAGDLDQVARLSLDDWTPGTDADIVDKAAGDTAAGAWEWFVTTTGALTLGVMDSTSTYRGFTSTAPVPATNGQVVWVRAALDVDDGAGNRVCRFYYSTESVDDPASVTWTQLGTDVSQAGAIAIQSGTYPLRLGANNNGTRPLAGRLLAYQAKSGIGGTVVARYDADDITVNAEATTTTDLPVPFVHLDGTGDYISTPDSAALDITGDIDLRAHVALDDWTPAATQFVISKNGYTANGGYSLYVSSFSRLVLRWSTGAVGMSAETTVALPFSDGEAGWVRTTLDVDNGAGAYNVTFYTSTDGVTWTQLGDVVAGTSTTSIASNTAAPVVGAHFDGSSALSGLVFAAEVRNGIDGTVVASYRATDAAATGETTTTSSATGEVWTYQGNAKVFRGTAWTYQGDAKAWADTPWTLVDDARIAAGPTEVLVTSNDVYVRVAAGGRKDIDRPVGGDGVRLASGVGMSSSFVDRAPRAKTEYEYRVKATGDNETSTWSAWTPVE